MQPVMLCNDPIKIFLLPLILFSSFVSGQVLPLHHAFAHNDYWHKHPLYDALQNGYSYIEADIYLRKGQLVVAHVMPVLRKKRTLGKLYLEPLYREILKDSMQLSSDYHEPVTLMIDIKSDANKTYEVLKRLLEKYKSVLSGFEHGKRIERQITIVLTGHKPYDIMKQEANRYAFIDEDLRHVNKDLCSDTIYPIASCKYVQLVKWKGAGVFPDADKNRLRKYVSEAHAYGKKVRLWASPDNKAVWNALLNCGVDLICTDKLAALRKFLLTSTTGLAKE